MAQQQHTTDDEGSNLGLLGLGVVVLTVIAVAVFIVTVVASNTADEKSPGGTELTAAQTEGRQVFQQNCSNCHTLGANKAPSTVGPDLDQLKPPRALVLDAIENGRARGNNLMPAELVSGEAAENVADYIVAVAGEEAG